MEVDPSIANCGKVLNFSPKKKINAPMTALPSGAGVPEGEPVFETTVAETMAVKKWIEFSLNDIYYQLDQISKDKKTRPAQFKEAKQTAEILATFLLNTLASLDAKLSTITFGPQD